MIIQQGFIIGHCTICMNERAIGRESESLETIICEKCGLPFDVSHERTIGACVGYMAALRKMTGNDDKAARSVPEIMREGADTYEQRNALWGDNYKEAGAVMMALLPRGIELRTADDWNRFGLFMHVMNKVTRYAQNLDSGGNLDSAHDLMVYAAMLEEMTEKR
jgi:hypothetical protein